MAESDARLQVVLEAKIDKLIERLNTANRAVYGAAGKFERDVNRINRKFQTMGSGLGVAADRIGGYLAAIGVALSIREVQQYADAWTNARNKLAAAGVATGDLARRQNELADLANRTRSGFSETVDLYAKLTRATEDLGANSAQVARATEIVNKSFKAGGAAASEQAAGILQLSQALGSGVLQGDELRSLRENAPLLAKAIAAEFDTTIAGLKKLGSEGKLTSDRVFKAILNAGKDIDAQFSKTIPTISDSFQRLQTEFGRYINSANAATGASAQLAGFINQVADNFDALADAAVVTASVIGGALAGQALARAVTGLSAIAAGATGAAGAMGLLRAAMAFLGGPWGVAITAIGAALGYLALESGKAKVEFAALEQRVNGQADAHDRVTAAADRQRQATGTLTAAELQAARQTAALTGEVKLLEDAHYRAAAAAKAHAIEEANARVEAAKTDAQEARRFAARAQRQVTAQIRGPIEPGSRGAAGGAALAGANPQGIIDRSVAATKEAKLLSQAEANLKKAEADLAAVRSRSLKDAGFQTPALKAPAASTGSKQTKAKSQPRDKTDERLAQIDAALADAQQRLVGAMLNLATDVDERAKLQKRIIDADLAEADARVRKQQADIDDDKGLDAAEKQRLKIGLAIVRVKQKEAANLERELVDREAAEQKARDALDLELTRLDGEEDLVQIQRQLARTSRGRLAAELELLDLAEQRAKAELDVIEATKGTASAEYKIAAQRLDNLRNSRPGREAEARQQNASPLQDYLNTLPQSADEANERFEALAANGISDVVDGLAQAIVGTRSLGDVFKSVIAQMAVDLTRLNLQRALMAFLPGAVSGSSGVAPSVNGVFGYASGGLVRGPGSGTSDDVMARLSNGEFVVNAAAAKRNLGLLRAINSGLSPRAMGPSVRHGDTFNLGGITITGADMVRDPRRAGAQVAAETMRHLALAKRRGF
jgi:tape measure domain-containing protein